MTAKKTGSDGHVTAKFKFSYRSPTSSGEMEGTGLTPERYGLVVAVLNMKERDVEPVQKYVEELRKK